jgi:glc operon protein GlcG
VSGVDAMSARRGIDVLIEAATALGVRVSVAVVDERGHDVVVQRMDGAAWFTAGIARSKAQTSAAFATPSGQLEALQEAYPEVYELAAAQLAFRPTTLPGGITVTRDGVVVAAIGVSGATPEQDVELAQRAEAVLFA